METSLVTCVVCPKGCSIEVSWELGDDGSRKVVEVVGNSCPRGFGYASSEVVHPKRVLTTTVRLVRDLQSGSANGLGSAYELLPVRSAQSLPKESMMDAMEEVSKKAVALYHRESIKMGDVVVSDVAGTGIDMVACRDSRI